MPSLEDARQRLLQERAEVMQLGRDLTATFDNMVEAAQDSNLDDEHDPEGSTIAAEPSLTTSLSASAAARLAQIEAALVRVEDGTYGSCLRCGRAIGAGRLDARPDATLCIDCARQLTGQHANVCLAGMPPRGSRTAPPVPPGFWPRLHVWLPEGGASALAGRDQS